MVKKKSPGSKPRMRPLIGDNFLPCNISDQHLVFPTTTDAGGNQIWTLYVLLRAGICIAFDSLLRVDNESYCVRACMISHTVPCWGFVIQEKSKPGRYTFNATLILL